VKSEIRNNIFNLPEGSVINSSSVESPGIVIGDQVWAKKNVDVDIAGSRVYDDNEANRDIYGGLYSWNMISEIEALYPGWHVPTKAEFETLSAYLGGLSVAGGKLKEAGLSHWNAPNAGADNSSGFTALGAGHYNPYFTSYFELLEDVYYWSVTESISSPSAYYAMELEHTSEIVTITDEVDVFFFSIRLIKD